ncbi:hypothetical protein ES707_16507 [subsurface metagenome]
MKTRISEDVKIDIGLVSQALDNTNAIGKYHSLKDYRSALAILSGGAMAATKTTKIELLQAKDAAGTDNKGIPTTADQEATAEITANALVTELTVTLTTFLADGTITINDLVFTAHATVTTPANREFSISGNDTADAAELVTCINDATHGVPGITASNVAGVVTLKATDPGEKVVTVSSSPDDGTCVKATTKAQAFVEILSTLLDKVNDFTHIAVKVTTTATSNVAAVLERGNTRFTPDQKVGASAIV